MIHIFRHKLLLGLLLAVSLFVGYFLFNQVYTEPTANHHAELQSAWRKMQQTGEYQFSTKVEQIIHPAPSLTNVGASSEREIYYLEGTSDLSANSIEMRFYQGDGNLLNTDDALEIRVEDHQAFGRSQGSDWITLDNFSMDSFAPGNDFSSFLLAAKNVTSQGVESYQLVNDSGETRNVNLNHYSFDIDSTRFAAYMRDEMTAEYNRTGKLPLGMNLSLSDEYLKMLADGQIWVSEDNLPVRMDIHMKLPQTKSGEQIEAYIHTDFYEINQNNLLAAQPLPVKIAGFLGVTLSVEELKDFSFQTSIGFGFLILLTVLVANARRKSIYAIISGLVIATFIFSPIWQSNQTVVFAKELQEKQASIDEQKQAAVSEIEALKELYVSDWNPQQNPLQDMENSNPATLPNLSAKDSVLSIFSPAALAQSGTTDAEEEDVDTDQDGLTDAFELEYDISQFNPNDPDTDDDGLNDGEEYRLGLNSGNEDSDGDGIGDLDEVNYFYYRNANRPLEYFGEWYSNPTDHDTDRDGILDGTECPSRKLDQPGHSSAICEDFDQDGIPNIFDTDDDNDGVPTNVDSTPYGDASTLYTNTSPLKISVDNLTEDEPVFYDFELRPQNPEHLTYIMNVLDWPSKDNDGQIMRINDTTFHDTMDSVDLNADPRFDYGDMRLIPMLELKITGNLPLPLTDSYTAILNAENFSGELTLKSTGPGVTQITLSDAPAGTYPVYYGAGSCDDSSNIVALGDLSLGGTGSAAIGLGNFADGDYSVFVFDENDEDIVACTVPYAAHGTFTDQVIDSEIINAYGGFVRNETDGSVLLYMPLSVHTDITGNSPVAFNARVPFMNEDNRFDGSSQDVRMVWMINMLTDICKPMPADLGKDETWCDTTKPEQWIPNVGRVVHTYEDSFYLTSLKITEEQGMDMNVFFEDPAEDLDKDSDDPLWKLSYGLQSTFTAGRADTTLDELYTRFDTDVSTVPDGNEKLWGIPAKSFQVKQYHFDYADQIYKFVSQDAGNPNNLEHLFGEYFPQSVVDTGVTTTILLYARQNNFRLITVGDSDQVNCTGSACHFDFASEGVLSTALVNWAPFKFTAGDGWNGYPLEDYLDMMESRLREAEDFLAADDSVDERNLVDGKIYIARFYFESMYRGVTGLRSFDNQTIANPPSELSDFDIYSDFNGLQKKGAAVGKIAGVIADAVVRGLDSNLYAWVLVKFGNKTDKVKGFFIALGDGLKQKAGKFFDLLKYKLLKVVVGVALAAVIIAVVAIAVIYFLDPSSPTGKILGKVLTCILSTIAIIAAVMTIKEIVSLGYTLNGALQKATIIGAIVAGVITWGIFVYTWVASDVSVSSIAFTSMLADAIAATMTIILMAAIASTGVGAIIIAVVAIIDALITAVCAATGVYDREDDDIAKQYICIGISGWVTKIFKWFIYSNTFLVDYDNSDRLSFTGLGTDLQNENLGFVSTNKMAITVSLKNTITLSDIPIDWKAAAYWWQYSGSNAKTATFAYAIQPGEDNIHSDLSRGSMKNEWTATSEDDQWYVEESVQSDGYSIDMPSPGINQDPTANLTEGSAIPVQECWVIPPVPPITFFPIPICYIRTEKNSFHMPLDGSLTLDVFPATLDEFYTLTEPSAYGFALDWDQSGDLKFPILQDADGDTLRSKHFGGNDPDDSRFDTDNDGISDKGEMSLGSSPVLFDTDDDGLNDLDELLAGTSLTRKDTDGDGLTDDLELQGWLFTYGFEADGTPKETMVYPSPMLPDTDLDGISDLEEKIYGFNPNVRETANILDYNLEMREIDAPIVSLQLDETSAAQIFADRSGFKFDAVCSGDTCPLSGVEGRYLNAVRFDGNDVLTLPASNNQISFLNDRAFTLAAWVKPESDGTLLAKWQNGDSQHELVWGLAGGYPTLMNAQNVTVTSTEAIGYNEWSHLAVSYDGAGTVRFYVNGEANSISHSWTNLVDPIAASLSPVSLGAMLSGSGTPETTYNGWLDEVQVYDHRVESVTLSEEDFIRTRIMTHRYNVQDQFVRPDEKLVLHSEVENLLNSRFAYGLLQTILDQTSAVMDWMELLIPETFVLYPKNPVVTGVNIYESDKEINLDPAYQQSVDLKIEQDASAQIVDRRTESNYAQLWLKFNETGSEVPAIDFATAGFEDSSGNMPPRKSTCTTCPGIGAIGILNNAIQFASGANTPVSLPSLSTLELLDRGYTISAWVRPEGTSMGTLTVLNSAQLAISLVADGNAYRVDVSHNGLNITKTSVINRSVITNQWNHLVVRYNDGSDMLDIYINGARVATASSVPAVIADAALTLGGTTPSRAYRIDDLRIYNRPLTALDINRLAERPVLQLEMDTGSYADSSAYNQSITGRFLESINLSSASVRGSSLSPLSGSNPGFLEVSGNNLLDMGDGVFTFSLWVYPEDRNTSVWQGIFGKREYGQEAHAAPTLERNRNGDLRFGFGDGSAYRSTTANGVLANNKWYHIVITFKPNISGNYEYRLYLNSILTQSYEFSQKPEAGHSTYFIGHSSSIYQIHLGTLRVDDEHDAGSHAEPYIEEYRNGIYYTGTDGSHGDPLGEQSMGDGDEVYVNHWDTITNYESVKYTVWEEDSTSADDNCGSIYVDWYDLPVNNRRVSLDDGFDGWIEYSLQRTSTSFSGKIDQLEVYRYAIDSEQAFDLYTALPITLRMPLDDRPASDQFINTAVIGDIDDGDCAGNACPSAGTVGLLNQAVRFDGLDDVIDVPVATTSDYMVSLWVNTTCANCGLYTLEQTAGGVSLNQIYLRNGNVCSLSGSNEVCSRGGQVKNGQWHHVVYSNKSGVIDLWLDGVIVNSIAGSALIAAGAGNVRLGMAFSAEKDYLSGQLDDVRVFRYSQAAEVVAQLKQRAPFFLSHLDDEDVADGILEDTPANWNLVCDSASGKCPQAGVKGRLGTAMQFDGVDDFVTLEQNVLSDTAKSFTSTIWVKPTDVFDTTQTLWTLWNRDNSNLKYSLGIQPAGMKVCVYSASNPIACDSPSNVELVMNVWNQVTLVVNQTSTTNESFELYINGYLDSTGAGNTGSAVSTGFGKLDLGNQQSGAFAGGDYIGVMDEVSLYSVTLNEIDVRNTFHYQMEHVEEMESITVTIDADAPQAQLVSYNPDFPYLSSVDRIIQVDALDLTSGIAAVEMILDHQNAPDPQKTMAPVCIDSLNGTSFCPTFDPKFGEGAYELTFRAIDAVGHEQISDPVTLYVDGTPPRVTTNIVLNSIYAALPYGVLEDTWYLHLGGTLLDEALSGVIAGSGLELNSVRVTIYNEFGGVVGIGNQQPELVWDGARYNWNHDYLFPENEPTGKMSLVVEASDKVGNLKTAQIAFYLDATAPVGKLDESSVPNTDFAAIIEGSKSADDTVLREQELTGSASDIPGQKLPYMSPAGEAAASRVDQVQMGIDPALGVSYLFNEPYPEGLLAWLPLDKEEIPNGAGGNPDENAANRYYLDISPWQISGTCEMPNCPQPGQIGHKNGAMYFDGNHRYINLGNQVDLANKSFTISLWAQRESLNRNDPILWQGPLSLARQRFLFGYNTENQMVCGFGGSDLVTSEAVLDGLWHNWACNYDVVTKQRTLWLDGKAVASDTANPMLTMEENLFIGLAPVGSYKGDLDEVVVYDRALTSSEIREQFTGYQPVFHLTVDDDFIRNGDFLNEVSGFYQVSQMKTTAGDISNKVAAGKQGDYALGMNGADRVLVSADYSLNLDRAQFTEMAWVYPLSLTGLTGVFTQNDENPEMRYPSLFITADGAIKSGFGNGYNWFETSTASGLIQTNSWNHLAATFDGQTYKTYLNGRLVHSDVSLNGLLPYPSETFALGDSLNGMLDEVSIYPRALSAEEIYAFHQMNWKETTLDNQGNEVAWRGMVPYGLEGSYNVNIRAWDSGSHFTANSKTMIQWGGLVDSFPPRLTVLREEIDPEDPYKLRYTFEVIDTMLDQTTIRQNLCESITYEKEYFNSSWYLAGGVAPNTGLYRIAGTCLADGRTTEETGIVACDVGGNCSARTYSAVLTERVYLPLVTSSGGGGSVPEPPSAAWLEKVLELAQTWPTLIDSQQIQPIETPPVIEFDQDVLTDQDHRSIMHINLKGNVENPSAINTFVINIWKDNELVATTQATIYQNRWNAPWMFLPGNPPKNGDYVLEVILTDNSGETTLYNHPITVQGSFSK